MTRQHALSITTPAAAAAAEEPPTAGRASSTCAACAAVEAVSAGCVAAEDLRCRRSVGTAALPAATPGRGRWSGGLRGLGLVIVVAVVVLGEAREGGLAAPERGAVRAGLAVLVV